MASLACEVCDFMHLVRTPPGARLERSRVEDWGAGVITIVEVGMSDEVRLAIRSANTKQGYIQRLQSFMAKLP